MFEKLNSRQLLETLQELMDAINNDDGICKSRNGELMLKSCPECGFPVKVFNFEFSGTKKDLDAILNSAPGGGWFDRWEKYLSREAACNRLDYLVIRRRPEPVLGRQVKVACDCHSSKWRPSYVAACCDYLGGPMFSVLQKEDWSRVQW